MNPYHKLFTPEGTAVVFIDHQPPMNFGVANIDDVYTMVHKALQSAKVPQVSPPSKY